MKLDSTALLAAAALYATLMPNLSDVRRAHVGSEEARDVRNGIAVGSGLLVGIGALMASEERSPRPLYMLGGVAVLVALAFELTLRQRSTVPTAEPGPHRATPALGRYGL